MCVSVHAYSCLSVCVCVCVCVLGSQRREWQFYQESATQGKIAVIVENWTPITAKSATESLVPARGVLAVWNRPDIFFGLGAKNSCCFFLFCSASIPSVKVPIGKPTTEQFSKSVVLLHQVHRKIQLEQVPHSKQPNFCSRILFWIRSCIFLYICIWRSCTATHCNRPHHAATHYNTLLHRV